jgi:hypothetical protein
VEGTLQSSSVEPCHAHHGLVGAFRLLQIGIRNHFEESFGNNLPGNAEFILNPPATLLSGVAAILELVPVVFDFGLVSALDLEGYCWAELELRSTIQCREGLAVQFEGDHHDGAGFLPMNLHSCFAVMLDVGDLSTFEDGCVEIGRCFRLAVEPKTWSDLRRHCILVSSLYERAG